MRSRLRCRSIRHSGAGKTLTEGEISHYRKPTFREVGNIGGSGTQLKNGEMTDDVR